MKKILPLFAAALLTTAASSVFAEGGKTTFGVDAIVGKTYLNESDYNDLEVSEPTQLGMGFSFSPAGMPLDFAFTYLKSVDSGTNSFTVKTDLAIQELRFGVKKIFNKNAFIQPVVGVGITTVNTEIKQKLFGVDLGSTDDTTSGLYVEAGIRFQLVDMFHVGAMASVTSVGKQDLGMSGKQDPSGTYVSLIAGFDF